jgi:filamentous hemagglutinin family protein
MKQSSRFFAWGLLLELSAVSTFANPQGGVVASGAASITPSGSLLTINQSSSRAIINWGSFNIANGETTVFQFAGPAGVNSAVLNKIAVGNPSTIAGTLRSTVGPGAVGDPVGGTVMIINPQGILFTGTSQIQVGSLIATTLNLADDNEFLNNTTLHLGPGGTDSIKNQGTISALGDVFLIAHTVKNEGSIEAGGVAGLAAGTTVTLAQSGVERITVEAGTGVGTPVGVENSLGGQIKAVSTELKAAGGNIYALAINNGGEVRATSVVNQNGRISLRAVDTANGATKGNVASTGTIGVGGIVTTVEVAAEGADVQISSIANGGAVSLSGATKTIGSVNAQSIQADGGNSVISGQQTISASASYDAATVNAAVSAHDVSFGGTVSLNVAGTVANPSVQSQGGGQTYNGAVTLGQNTVLKDTTGGNIRFLSTVDAANAGVQGLTTRTDGNVEFNGAVGAARLGLLDVGGLSSWANGQTLLNAPSLSAVSHFFRNPITQSANVQVAGTDLTVSKTWNASGFDVTLSLGNSVTVPGTLANVRNFRSDGAGGTIIDGSFTTTGQQVYGNAVTLSPRLSFAALQGTAIAFDKTVDGNQALFLTGPSTFSDKVGFTTPLASLSVNGSANLNGGVVTTAGAQQYFGPVSLGQNVVLNATAIDLPGVTGNGRDLTLNDSVIARLNGAVTQVGKLALTGAGYTAAASTISADSVAADQTIVLNGGSVTTVNGQTYTKPMVLGADTTLQGTTLALADVTGQNHNLSLVNAGVGSLNGPVNGVGTLTANGAGTLAVNNSVSAVTLIDNEATTLNSGTIQTGGGQTYTKDLTLGADTTLTGTTLSLAKVTGNGWDLTLANSGAANLNGAVAGVDLLQASGAGTLAINGTVSANSLTDKETTTLAGGSVTTVGAQSYTKTVNLAQNTTLNGTIIDLAAVTGNNKDLTVNDSVIARLNGPVTQVGKLALTGNGYTVVGGSVTADSVAADQAAVLNGGSVVTVNGQSYAKSLVLGADTTLQGTTLDFAAITGNGHHLTLANSGAANLNGAVAGVGNLTANGAGTLAVNNTLSAASVTDDEVTALNGGTVVTTAGQTYSKDVSLGADTTLTGTALGLAKVTGNGWDLNLVNSGLGTLNGPLAGVDSLQANGSGTLAVNSTISAGSFGDNEITTLAGGAVTTSGAQNYTRPVELGQAATLTGTVIDLSAVTGNGNDLTINDGTIARLNGPVLGVGRLALAGAGYTVVGSAISADSVAADQTAVLSGGSVTTVNGQDYAKPVVLGVDTTLTGTKLDLAAVTGNGHDLTLLNSGSANLNGAVSGVGNLTANGAGTLAVNNTLSAVSVTDNEVTALNGGTVATTAGQVYSKDVTLGADTTLSGTALSLAKVTGNGYDLNLVNSGAATLNGPVAGVDLLQANGAGTLAVNDTVSAGTFADNEVTALNGGSVSTTAGQKYTRAVALGKNTTLNGSTLELASVVGNNWDLIINDSVAARLNGAVNQVGKLALTGAGYTVVGGTVSADSVAADQVAVLDGGSVTTVNGQSYTKPVSLGADTTLTGTTLDLDAVTGNGHGLALVNSGAATLNGAVSGVTDLTATGSGTLAVNNTVSAASFVDDEVTTLNGGSVVTSAGQSYSKQVTLGQNTTLTGSTLSLAGVTGAGKDLTLKNSGTATLNGAVQDVGELKATGTGDLVVNNAISAGSLTDAEVTKLNGGSIVTVGNQSYTKAVTLGVDNTLQGTAIAFSSTVDGGQSLTVNGGATFGDAVGNNTELTALTISGKTSLNGGTVKTTGAQAYNDAVTLGTDNVLSGSSVGFASTVDGAHGLTVNGATTLGGRVGDAQQLTALTIDGTAALNGGSVKTTGAQDYKGAVTLGTDNTLSGSAVGFASTVDGAHELTVDGPATLGGKVGEVAALAALNLKGTAALNGGSVKTTGAQDYKGAVTLGTDNTLSGSAVGFAAAVDGAHGLTVNGATTLGAKVGEGTELAALTLNGTAALNGGSVKTTGAQAYNGEVALGSDNVLNGSTIGFGSTVNGAYGLTANGATTLGGSVGNATKLTALAVNGTAALNGGSVKTIGGQAYNGAVSLGSDNTLEGSAIGFASSVNGANSLTTKGGTTLGGSVGDAQPLNTLTVDGGAALNGGSVRTSGAQTYNGAVDLGTDNSLTGSAIGFGSTVNGARQLTANGSTTLGARVGDATPLEKLTVNGPTAINGGAVNTSGSQNYNGSSSLGAATVFSGTEVTLGGDLNAQNNAITVNGHAFLGSGQSRLNNMTSLTVAGPADIKGDFTQNASFFVLLDINGPANFAFENISVNQQNKLYNVVSDFRDWSPGTLMYDSLTEAFYTSFGPGVPAEDLFRRILGASLPQLEKGKKKRVEGQPGPREKIPPGYNMGSTEITAVQ